MSLDDFEALFRRFAPYVMRIALRVLGRYDEALRDQGRWHHVIRGVGTA